MIYFGNNQNKIDLPKNALLKPHVLAISLCNFTFLKILIYLLQVIDMFLRKGTLRFDPPINQSIEVKDSVVISVNTRYQCITAMAEYQDKSLEVST